MIEGQAWFVSCFYRFLPLDEPALVNAQSAIRRFMEDRGILGLVLLAPEGINGTVGGPESAVEELKRFVSDLLGVQDLTFKDSTCAAPPFHRVSVDRRREIVGLKRPDLVPSTVENRHLSPREWHQMMQSNGPKLVIDTRNKYETLAGKFKGAIDPEIKTFSEWGSYLEESGLPKDVPVLIYCTGGIRCEKAILEMQNQGFEKVYQLRDGILGYLAEYPDGYYEGECFVFDDRVTVGANLKPTGNFGICPGCGLTSSTKKECQWCSGTYFVCRDCESTWDPVCSKTCQDRLKRHGSKAFDL